MEWFIDFIYLNTSEDEEDTQIIREHSILLTKLPAPPKNKQETKTFLYRYFLYYVLTTLERCLRERELWFHGYGLCVEFASTRGFTFLHTRLISVWFSH